MRVFQPTRRGVLGVCAATYLVLASACAPQIGASDDESPASAPDKITNDDSVTLEIWTDGARQPGFEAYQAAHPDVKMNITLIDAEQIPTKIQLANQTGSGWPDVLWPGPTANHWLLASDAYQNFSQPLDGIVPDDVLEGFGDTLNACTFDGRVYCLRNDLAPTVLYYNSATMAEFGYDVPTTMTEFAELAEQVAVEHPGYVVQVLGDNPNTYLQFYESSGCPFAEVDPDDRTSVTVDWSDPRCERATEVLDRLLATGIMSTDTLNEGQQAALGSEGKVLMTVAAAWRADFTFAGAWQWPAGELGVAPMPTWGDAPEDQYTGTDGGGGYVVSRHSENLEGAIDIIEWMTTSPDFQLTAGTLPAYEPVQEGWSEAKVLSNPLYADPEQALQVYLDASAAINPHSTWVGYNMWDAFLNAVMPGIQAGESLASLIPHLQEETANLATTVGYDVVTP